MKECKHLHSTQLSTDSFTHMQWGEKLSDGRLFTLMAVGKPDGIYNAGPCSQFVFGRISEDSGKTWEKPYFLYEWPDHDTSYLLLGWKIDRDGRLHVFAEATTDAPHDNPKKLEGHIAYVRFDSYRGENPLYSDITALYRYTGSLNNIIETEAGRLVVPFSTFMGDNFVSGTIWSDDHGVSWKASNDVSVSSEETSAESGAVEPVVAEVQPGVLVMLIRTVLFRLWYAVSYDSGESWSKAKPTNLPSCNAPANLLKLPDGRILLTWNDGLGHPMADVRYSLARQCLHAAVSSDGLKSIHGARIIVKKEVGDQDRIHNAYPTASNYSENEVLLWHFEVFGKCGSSWKALQGYLVRMNPAFLEETEVKDNWAEWISDSEKTSAGIVLKNTNEIAHAITNFPYAKKGSIKLAVSGILPQGTSILLSDCYLDRLNFIPENKNGAYKGVVGEPYTRLSPNAAGEWLIEWDETEIRLSVDGKQIQTCRKNTDGFNHITVLFEKDGELRIGHFHAKAEISDWDTGIRY